MNAQRVGTWQGKSKSKGKGKAKAKQPAASGRSSSALAGPSATPKPTAEKGRQDKVRAAASTT